MQQKQMKKFSDSSSGSDGVDGESSCEEFAIVQTYNEQIRAIYEGKLKEKVLEALAFHTSASQIKRERT